MNIRVIYTTNDYTTNDYTTVYDIIKNADYIPTLDEWLYDIESDEEREQAEKALENGNFTFEEC